MGADSRGPELAAVVIFLAAFAIFTVVLRCYSMGFLLRRFFVEDYLAIVTLFFYVAYSAFALLSIHYGLGQHVSEVPADQHQKALLWKWLAQVTYVLIAVLVKFIVGLFILRICIQQRVQRIAIYTMLAVVAVFNAFYICIVIFQCRPVEFYWFRYTKNSPVTGECHKTMLATIPTYVSLVMNVVVDWLLALLPVSFIWNSNMDRKTKLSVIGVLGIGSIASLATCARIPYAKQLLSNPDYLYNFTDLAIWSTVEIGLALSASSLATLKPLFRKIKLLPSKLTSRNTTRPTGGLTNTEGTLQSHPRKGSIARIVPLTPRNFEEIREDTWKEYDSGFVMQKLEGGSPTSSSRKLGFSVAAPQPTFQNQNCIGNMQKEGGSPISSSRKQSFSALPTFQNQNWSGNRSIRRNDDRV